MLVSVSELAHCTAYCVGTNRIDWGRSVNVVSWELAAYLHLVYRRDGSKTSGRRFVVGYRQHPTQTHVIEQSLMRLEMLVNRKRKNCRWTVGRPCRRLSALRRSSSWRPAEQPSQSQARRLSAFIGSRRSRHTTSIRYAVYIHRSRVVLLMERL